MSDVSGGHGHSITAELQQAGPPRIRVAVWWLAAVALMLAIILEVATIVLGVILAGAVRGIADELGTIDPTPAITGCPFDETACGG